jgi:hypothetical protein
MAAANGRPTRWSCPRIMLVGHRRLPAAGATDRQTAVPRPPAVRDRRPVVVAPTTFSLRLCHRPLRATAHIPHQLTPLRTTNATRLATVPVGRGSPDRAERRTPKGCFRRLRHGRRSHCPWVSDSSPKPDVFPRVQRVGGGHRRSMTQAIECINVSSARASTCSEIAQQSPFPFQPALDLMPSQRLTEYWGSCWESVANPVVIGQLAPYAAFARICKRQTTTCATLSRGKAVSFTRH